MKPTGFMGFFSGVGQGAVGVVTKPGAGAVSAAKIVNDSYFKETQKLARIRTPRAVFGDHMLRSFDADNAAIFWHLQKWEVQLREKGDTTKADKLALRIAMDSSEDWETNKDAEKRARYAPVLDFFNSLNQGWTLRQLNFTVGVRGSISNVDRTEPLSFLSTLKTLGITSRVHLEKIRKTTAKRAFEEHDLLLRSYYAAKSSPSPSQTNFSGILGSAFTLQHCLRPSK
jgi:hypothetical protein